MCNKYDELGKGPPHFRAGTLQQVLGEAIGVRKEHLVCKPEAHVLAVTQQDAECIVPRKESRMGKAPEDL